MKKNKIADLRKKLREAEERGFITCLDMMQEFVDTRYDAEVKHRPEQNIYKRTLAATWGQMKRALAYLREGVKLDARFGPNQWERPNGTV